MTNSAGTALAHGHLLPRKEEATMKKTALLAAALALFAAPAFAHHADVMFDKTKDMTLSGTVLKFENVNPHSMIELQVADRGKAPVVWQIETDSPIMLQKAGIEPMLKENEKVTVRIHPLKDGKPGGSLIALKKSDGSVVMVPEPGKIYGTKPLPFGQNENGKAARAK